jgi:hypothetical protein
MRILKIQLVLDFSFFKLDFEDYLEKQKAL